MAQMINVTKMVYDNESVNLQREKFIVNADNIKYIENSKRDSWEKSILVMMDSTTIDVVETQSELKKLINWHNKS